MRKRGGGVGICCFTMPLVIMYLLSLWYWYRNSQVWANLIFEMHKSWSFRNKGQVWLLKGEIIITHITFFLNPSFSSCVILCTFKSTIQFCDVVQAVSERCSACPSSRSGHRWRDSLRSVRTIWSSTSFATAETTAVSIEEYGSQEVARLRSRKF